MKIPDPHPLSEIKVGWASRNGKEPTNRGGEQKNNKYRRTGRQLHAGREEESWLSRSGGRDVISRYDVHYDIANLILLRRYYWIFFYFGVSGFNRLTLS
jgi:hypothetical protein